MAGISRLSKLSLSGNLPSSNVSSSAASQEEEANDNVYTDLVKAQADANTAIAASTTAQESAKAAQESADKAKTAVIDSMRLSLEYQNETNNLINNTIEPINVQLQSIEAKAQSNTDTLIKAQENMGAINSTIDEINTTSHDLQKKVEDMQNDINAANTLISQSTEHSTPILQSMNELLDELEKQAQETTGIKETQSITLDAMNDIASANATYAYETDKSAVKWKQVYTASMDAYANETPEVQKEIMTSYAALYGGYVTGYYVDENDNILVDNDGNVVQSGCDNDKNYSRRYCCSVSDPKNGIKLNENKQIDTVDATNCTNDSAQGKLNAAKAGKIEALKTQNAAQKEVNEAQNSVDYYTNIQDKVTKAKEECSNSLDTAKTNLGNAETKVKNAEDNFNTARDAYINATAEFQTAETNYNKAKGDYNTAKSKEAESYASYMKAQNEYLELEKQYNVDESVKDALVTAQDKRDKAYAAWVGLQKEYSAATTAYNTAEGTYNSAQKGIGTAYAAYIENNQVLNQTKKECITAQSAVDSLNAELKHYTAQLKEIKENLGEAKETLINSEKDLATASNNLENANVNLTEQEEAVQLLLDGIHVNYKSSIEQTAKGIKLQASKNEKNISTLQVDYDAISTTVEGLKQATDLKQTDKGWTISVVDLEAVVYNQTFYKATSSSSSDNPPTFKEGEEDGWSETIPETDATKQFIWSASKTARRKDYNEETEKYTYQYSTPICINGSTIEVLQGQIDGAIQTWFEEGEPSGDKDPSKKWDNTTKENHLGDLYYDTKTGHCYRYQYANEKYQWSRIADTDVTAALESAKAALESAKVAKEAADKAVISTIVEYATSTSATTSGTNWSTKAPEFKEGEFVWMRQTITYGDKQETTEPVIITGNTGANGKDGTSVTVKSTLVQYASSSSGTNTPSSWQDTIPPVEAGSYLWTKTTVTYSDGKNTVTYTIALQGKTGEKGDKGETGATGNGIQSVIIAYQAGTSGTIVPTEIWQDSISKVSISKGQYLWARTTTSYTNGTSSVSYSVTYQAQDGNGIASIDYTYATSDSQVAPEAEAITDTVIPTLSASQRYLWQKEVINYTEGDSKETVTLLAVYGDKGDKGIDITSYLCYYQQVKSGNSTTKYEEDPSQWSTDIPTYAQGNTLYFIYVTTYSDGTIKVTDPQEYQDWGAGTVAKAAQEVSDQTNILVNSQLVKDSTGLYAVYIPQDEVNKPYTNQPAVCIGTSDNSGVISIGEVSCHTDELGRILNDNDNTVELSKVYNTIGKSGNNIYVDVTNEDKENPETRQSLAASYNNTGLILYSNEKYKYVDSNNIGQPVMKISANGIKMNQVTIDENNSVINNQVVDIGLSNIILGKQDNIQIVLNYQDKENANITFTLPDSTSSHTMGTAGVTEIDGNDDSAILKYAFNQAGVITSDLAKFPQVQSCGQLIIGNDIANTVEMKDDTGTTTSNQSFVNGYSMRPLSDGSLGWFKVY